MEMNEAQFKYLEKKLTSPAYAQVMNIVYLWYGETQKGMTLNNILVFNQDRLGKYYQPIEKPLLRHILDLFVTNRIFKKEVLTTVKGHPARYYPYDFGSTQLTKLWKDSLHKTMFGVDNPQPL